MFVDGFATTALVDTGAAICIISEVLCRKLNKVTTPLVEISLRTASSQHVQPSATCTARVVIQGVLYIVEFVVLPHASHEIILGWNFLSANHAVVDCARAQLVLFPFSTTFIDLPRSPKKVIVAADVVISAFSVAAVSLLCNSVSDSTALFMPSQECARRRNLVVPFAVITLADGSSAVYVCNPFPCPATLLHGECIGSLDTYDDIFPFDARSDTTPMSVDAVTAGTAPSLPDEDVLLRSVDTGLTQDQRNQLIQLLDRFRASFDHGQPPLGRTSVVAHHIDTGHHTPLRQRPYRVSQAERDVITQHVDEMLQRGVIQHSHSPWASPVVLVRKKDGSIRFCVDYRRLNNITRKDVYPLPRIDDALDCLQGAEFFSSLDLRSGYWQVPMAEPDRPKTAFVTPDGLYEFNVMPFGLCNAPATFERMMDSVLRGLKWHICLCYLDDIVVFSANFETHLSRLEQVLQCLTAAGLQLNFKKCRFGARKLTILGHVVSKEGISPDPAKLRAVAEYPKPTTLKELCRLVLVFSVFHLQFCFYNCPTDSASFQ